MYWITCTIQYFNEEIIIEELKVNVSGSCVHLSLKHTFTCNPLI